LKELGSKLPETKVLENKLNKMVKLEPKIKQALQSVGKITEMPKKSELLKKEKATDEMVKAVEKATDGTIKAKTLQKEIKKQE